MQLAAKTQLAASARVATARAVPRLPSVRRSVRVAASAAGRDEVRPRSGSARVRKPASGARCDAGPGGPVIAIWDACWCTWPMYGAARPDACLPSGHGSALPRGATPAGRRGPAPGDAPHAAAAHARAPAPAPFGTRPCPIAPRPRPRPDRALWRAGSGVILARAVTSPALAHAPSGRQAAGPARRRRRVPRRRQRPGRH